MFTVVALRNALGLSGKIETPVIHSTRNDRHGSPIPAEFVTIEAARVAVEELDDAVYYAAHNENGRPEYLVLELDTAQNILETPNDCFDWDEMDVEDCHHADEDIHCGECEACFEFMRNQLREMIRKNAL